MWNPARLTLKTLKAFCYIVLSGSPWLSAPALAPLCTWELFVRPQHCGQLSVWLGSSVKQFSAVHGKTTLRVKQRPVYYFLLVLATSCSFFSWSFIHLSHLLLLSWPALVASSHAQCQNIPKSSKILIEASSFIFVSFSCLPACLPTCLLHAGARMRIICVTNRFIKPMKLLGMLDSKVGACFLFAFHLILCIL